MSSYNSGVNLKMTCGFLFKINVFSIYFKIIYNSIIRMQRNTIKIVVFNCYCICAIDFCFT